MELIYQDCSETMELLVLVLSAGLPLLLSLVLSVFLIRKPSKQQLPPGHTGWPFLGETLEFLSTGRQGSPEKFVTDRMAKHSPRIFTTSLLGEKMAVFCGPEGNKFLFSNENKLVTSWWPRSIDKLFPPERSTGEESLKMRKMTAGFVAPNSLRGYIGIMDSMARAHVEAYYKEGTVTYVLPLTRKFSFALACRLFLSIDDPGYIARIEKPFHDILSGVFAVPINFPGTAFNRAIRASKLIRKELLEIIRGRQHDKAKSVVPRPAAIDDILDHMLATADHDGRFLTEQSIANKMMGLLVGGLDSTSATVTFILNYLADNPRVYDQVLEEQMRVADGKGPGELLTFDDCQKMKYSWNVATEVLRLAPPIQGAFREAITDFTYDGFLIPKGLKLYWAMNSTHRNPDYFPEPETFDPSRFDDQNGDGPVPYAYVPFGGGPRMCPGKDYARMAILAFMYNLVRMFRWEKVFPNEKIVFNPMPMPANGLPIRLHRHN